jgi:serine/threonine protein kinase
MVSSCPKRLKVQAEPVVSTRLGCLADESIFAFVQGRLRADSVPELEEHLSVCADCRTVVAETARFFADSSANVTVKLAPQASATPELANAEPHAPLAPGTCVSRYVLAGVIGSGAAGIVYRAYDPELRREIALKLLRAGPSRGPAPLKARLLREAQAMARLSHPNVVSVYDVGTYGSEIFIVLELVKGKNLAEWLDETPRSWEEIRWAFVEAGKGLAAAHAVQLVHRDFKPANVLVGSDGRVRVTDFGLARPVELSDCPPLQRLANEVSVAAVVPGYAPFSITTTQAGLAGTPVYMAPEQFAQQRTDERTDQFGFCVALYLALYKRHPFLDFAGPERRYSLAELARQVSLGSVHVPPSSNVPAAIFGILQRGLAADPNARFPSMQELLTRLLAEPETARPRPRRARWATLSFALGIAIAALALAVPALHPNRPSPAPLSNSAPERASVLPAATASAEMPTLAIAPSAAPPPSAEPSSTARHAVHGPTRARTVRAPTSRALEARSPALPAGPKQYADGLKDPF